MPLVPLAVVLTMVAALPMLWRWWRRGRRRRLARTPLRNDWVRFIQQNVRVYRVLPADLKKQLHGHIQVFLHEKHFAGAAGLNITDEIRVTIAAMACLLILNRPTNYFRRLCSIVVYPSSFVAPRTTHHAHGVIEEIDEVLLGESWESGTVTLAWDQVKHGPWDTRVGQNVTIHEFAHQLDQEDGEADGAPLLSDRRQCASWARVLSREFELLQRSKSKGTVLDKYGASDPAEFFAVATEAFFEKPKQLATQHPELYEELRKYYRVDPAQWK